MLQRSFRVSAPALALTLSIPFISSGQPAAPPNQWSVITTSQIKPEFRAEYEAAQKEITAAYKKGGVASRLVVQTILGDVDEYISIAPLGKFAEMDEPTVLVKTLGAAGSQRLLKRIGAYLVSVHRAAVLSMEDISLRTPGDPGEYAHVATYRLLPGKAADFTAFMKSDLLPMMKKAGVTNVWMSRGIFGGDSSELVMVMPMHKLAELDLGPATTRALGADGAREFGVKQSKMVESVRRSIVHLRADLSYIPAPPKGTQ
jgi:hypothetical protein